MGNLNNYEKVERPWGNFERFTLNEPTTVKIITVNADESLSLQTHEQRDEFWYITAGSGMVQIGEAEQEAREGDNFFAPRNTQHRISAGAAGLTFLEVSFGDFTENDEKRLEDKYDRI